MIENILWVEDFDTRQAENDEQDDDREKDKQFGANYKNFVHLERKVYWKARKKGGVEYVTDNLFEYIDEHLVEIDCVVLDVNLKKGMPDNIKLFEEMAELFKKGGVLLGEGLNEAGREDIRKKGGFYLYLYLLHRATAFTFC